MVNAALVGLLIGSVGFTWLALFLLLRVQKGSMLIGVGVAALFGLALFFMSDTIRYTTTNREIYLFMQRGLLWSAFLPLAAWLHFCFLLHQHVRHSAIPRILSPTTLPVLAGYLAAILISLIAGSTRLIVDYETVTRLPDGTFGAQLGPLYPLNIAFNFLLTGGSLVYLSRALWHLERQASGARHRLRQQVRLLMGGGVLFFLGAVWWPWSYWSNLSVLPGLLVLCLGLGVVGYAMAQSGLLLTGQDAQRDFVYSSMSMLILYALYLGVFALTSQLTATTALVILLLVTLTHTAFDVGRNWLDQFFFSREEQEARAEARAYAATLAINPVEASDGGGGDAEPLDEESGDEESGDDETDTEAAADDEAIAVQPPVVTKQFKNNVRRAITNLKSPPRLAQSPLLTLELLSERLQHEQREDNRLNRTAALRELLLDYIDALRPTDTPGAQVGDAWRFYNVLYYPYVRETSRKAALAEIRQHETARRGSGHTLPDDTETVLRWLVDIEDATFYKWQRRASDAIATSLWEDNQQARQRRTQ
jgi:hypothetical protein